MSILKILTEKVNKKTGKVEVTFEASKPLWWLLKKALRTNIVFLEPEEKLHVTVELYDELNTDN